MSKNITSSRLTGFPIGELSRKTGVHIETIRYYERIGFVPLPPRGADGRRAFDEEDVKWLCFIKRSRDMGFSQESCGEVQALAETHLKDIRSKISDLKKMEAILAATVSKCTGEGAPACPVLDALSAT
jgi:MerR family mercuric resistance operon transcriptional regulator